DEADYEPLDLDAHRNGASTLLADEPPLGEQQLHGLPFLIGSGGSSGRAFVVPTAPVTIPVDRAAHTVVFAHRLIDSEILSGGPVGVVVAEYAFKLASGERILVP